MVAKQSNMTEHTDMDAFFHKIFFEHLLSNTVMGAEDKQGIIPPFSEAGFRGKSNIQTCDYHMIRLP